MSIRRFAAAAVFLAIGASGALAQERQWMLDTNDTESYLIFGVPETDDVGVSFWCTLQSDRIRLFVPEAEPTLTVGSEVDVKLTAGDEDVMLKGKVSANEEAGTTSVEAEFAADNPIFAVLDGVDRFAVEFADNRRVFPLTDADLDGFLEMCRSG